MPVCPQYVQDEVKRYDPNLFIRWSLQRKQFVLYRKVPYNDLYRTFIIHGKVFVKKILPEPIRWTTDGSLSSDGRSINCDPTEDRWIEYKENIIPVAFLKRIRGSILSVLYQHDAYRHGYKGKNMLADIAEKEKQIKARREEKLRQETRDEAADFYPHWMRMNGLRTSVSH